MGRVPNRSNTVFIDNLPQGIWKAWLFNLFSRFGNIQSIYVPNKMSQKTGNKFGFVRFGNPLNAQRAVEAVNGSWIWGKILMANIARFGIQKKSKSMQAGNYNLKGTLVVDGQETSSNGKEQHLSRIWRPRDASKWARAQDNPKKGTYAWRKKETKMDQKKHSSSSWAKVPTPVKVKEQGNGWLYRSAIAKLSSIRLIVRINSSLPHSVWLSISGYRADKIVEIARQRLCTIFLGGAMCIVICCPPN
ncbi:Polyadenylate-binding protein like [Actinidia chinensis var. chinensis]|uniref:Polyadenylate-binding protein like n=1 Tax=Actinidia chinensis var. chinensis TaxID=1590841 RepID=A0A2R6PAV7_ACTCC|nr:Polyadenylate-binding protein like [Actinidia chinensis var. chinensis]